jgi:hypothetical protein
MLGQPVVPNGIPLSKIHHAAFDAHLIGIDPDFRLHVAHRLMAQREGPMLGRSRNSMAGRSACPVANEIGRTGIGWPSDTRNSGLWRGRSERSAKMGSEWTSTIESESFSDPIFLSFRFVRCDNGRPA